MAVVLTYWGGFIIAMATASRRMLLKERKHRGMALVLIRSHDYTYVVVSESLFCHLHF